MDNSTPHSEASEPPRSFAELRRRYERGERDFRGCELDTEPAGDLSGVCLDDADFSQAWLYASFRGASLRNARFVESNVKICDFRDADLTNADFRGAALCATEFAGAILDGTRFSGAHCYGHTFGDDEKPIQ